MNAVASFKPCLLGHYMCTAIASFKQKSRNFRRKKKLRTISAVSQEKVIEEHKLINNFLLTSLIETALF